MGASEFYVTVIGYNEPEKVRRRYDALQQALLEFKLPSEKRWVPSLCLWETEDVVDLWVLSPASIERLKETGIGKLFSSGQQLMNEAETSSQFPLQQEEIGVHYLCLYRQGKPILAIFEEEFPELSLVLKRDEVTLFRTQNFGVDFEVIEDYYPDYFG